MNRFKYFFNFLRPTPGRSRERFSLLLCFAFLFLAFPPIASQTKILNPAPEDHLSSYSPALLIPILLSFNPRHLKSMADYDRAYDSLLKSYSRGFKKIRFNLSREKLSAMSVDEFLLYGHRVLKKWEDRKRRLDLDYRALARYEKGFLARSLKQARARDKQAGSLRHVQSFLKADGIRYKRRLSQVNRLQKLLDRNGVRLNRNFKNLYHNRLDALLKNLKARGATEDEIAREKERLVVSIKRIYGARSAVNLTRKRYLLHWSNWLFKKTFPPYDKMVVHKEKRPEPEKKLPEKITKKETPARESPGKEAVIRRLPCDNNRCNLAEYNLFYRRLPRSCGDSKLPDILIKKCYKDYVVLDTTSPRQKEIFNFMRFSSSNRFDRHSALTYYREICYPFRPIIEMSENLLARQNSPLNLDEKIIIQKGIDFLRSCPSK